MRLVPTDEGLQLSSQADLYAVQRMFVSVLPFNDNLKVVSDSVKSRKASPNHAISRNSNRNDLEIMYESAATHSDPEDFDMPCLRSL